VGGKDDGVIRIIFYGPRGEDSHLHCPAAAGHVKVDDKSGAQSPDAEAGPLGECPTVDIEGTPSKPAQAGEYLLSAYIAGGDPRFTPTYKWGVSAGFIVSGQGTHSVKINASGTDCPQITVTLEVGGIMPEGCQKTKTYTIERSKPH
jgi:hypothetical protein